MNIDSTQEVLYSLARDTRDLGSKKDASVKINEDGTFSVRIPITGGSRTYTLKPIYCEAFLPFPIDIVNNLLFYTELEEHETFDVNVRNIVNELVDGFDEFQKAELIFWLISYDIALTGSVLEFEKKISENDSYHEYLLWRKVRNRISSAWRNMHWKIVSKFDLEAFWQQFYDLPFEGKPEIVIEVIEDRGIVFQFWGKVSMSEFRFLVSSAWEE